MADAAETGPVRIVRLREGAAVPRRMSAGAAGMDLSASIGDPVILEPGQRAAIPTGLAMAIPPGFEGQVRPRSGLALRHGLTVANAPGTIDADYRGELMVILINLGREVVTIEPGQRIAQLVFAEVATLGVTVVETLDDTERGSAGFGSTGRGGGD